MAFLTYAEIITVFGSNLQSCKNVITSKICNHV